MYVRPPFLYQWMLKQPADPGTSPLTLCLCILGPLFLICGGFYEVKTTRDALFSPTTFSDSSAGMWLIASDSELLGAYSEEQGSFSSSTSYTTLLSPPVPSTWLFISRFVPADHLRLLVTDGT